MPVDNLYRVKRGPLRWFRIVDAISLLVQLLAYMLNRLERIEQWTYQYSVVA